MSNVIFKQSCTSYSDALGGDGNTYWEVRLTEGVEEFDYPANLELEFSTRTNGDSCTVIRIYGIETERLDDYIFALSKARDVLHAKELLASSKTKTKTESK